MAFCSSSCGAEVDFTCVSAIVELQEVWIMARKNKSRANPKRKCGCEEEFQNIGFAAQSKANKDRSIIWRSK